ncbi:MAG TPA: transcriptional regulator NrdR [Acidiferrobacteraceae bacterium]|nr:transcriptional regulator NrdR [Acidiferrobacteraceae bacterium]
MRCPFCGTDDTRVIDSRLAEEGDQVRRRRECPQCAERFTTFERAELQLPQIIKSDARRELFSAEKLRTGVQRALEKRPVDTARIDALVQHIVRRLLAMGEREVSSRQIGEWVMAELRSLDPVAYVRFASVYRSFQDVSAFRDEIERLQEPVEAGAPLKLGRDETR